MPIVLMLGDNDGTLQACARVLQNSGYHVRTASSDRLELALADPPFVDAVVTELRCADLPRARLLQQLQEATGGQLPTLVVMPPQHRRDIAPSQVSTFQHLEYVSPDMSDRDLIEAVDRALRRRGSTMCARVMVVAHNRLLRDALDAALTATTDLHVVVTTEDMSPAFVQCCMADVLLMDAAPSPDATIEHVRELAASFPHLKIIVLDVVHAGPELVELLEAGASGLLLNRATVDEILRTTRAVVGGATVIPQSVTSALLSTLAERSSHATIGHWQVTRREHQIIALIAEGLSNKEIAMTLNIATFTVKSHVHNILQKLGLHTRAQIARHVLLARRQHLAPAPGVPVRAPRPQALTTSSNGRC